MVETGGAGRRGQGRKDGSRCERDHLGEKRLDWSMAISRRNARFRQHA
jgi:hypothetical protein